MLLRAVQLVWLAVRLAQSLVCLTRMFFPFTPTKAAMLHSFDAQLQGNQLIWLGACPPPAAAPRRIVVVLDDAACEVKSDALTDIFNRARGSLGKGQRETVLAELARSRDEWAR